MFEFSLFPARNGDATLRSAFSSVATLAASAAIDCGVTRRCEALQVIRHDRAGRGREHCGRWLPSVLRVLPGVGAGHGAGAASTVALVRHPTSFLFSSLLPFCPVCRRRISTSSVATAVILLASIAGYCSGKVGNLQQSAHFLHDDADNSYSLVLSLLPLSSESCLLADTASL